MCRPGYPTALALVLAFAGRTAGQPTVSFVQGPTNIQAVANGVIGVGTSAVTPETVIADVQTGSGGVFGSARVSGSLGRDLAAPSPGSILLTLTARSSASSPSSTAVPSTVYVDIFGAPVGVQIPRYSELVVYRQDGFSGGTNVGSTSGTWATASINLTAPSGSIIAPGALLISTTATTRLNQPAGAPQTSVGGGQDLVVSLRPVGACPANCDGSTVWPVLNALDFACFLGAFQASAAELTPSQQAASYANCDRSTAPPALNALDFACFLNSFRQGCPVPAAPSALTASAGGPGRVVLSWSDNSTNETGFLVYSSTNNVSFLFERELGPNVTFTNLPQAQGTTRWYRVAALNEYSGPSVLSESVVFTAPVFPPAAPTGLAASGLQARQVTLTWQDNSNNEDGFLIARSTDGVNYTDIWLTPVNATQYTVTGLTPNRTYWFAVRAANSVAQSASSFVGPVTTPQELPAAPTSLQDPPENIFRMAADLRWTDNSDSEDDFIVERRVGTTWSVLGAPLAANAGTGIVTRRLSGLQQATTYTIRVKARNSAGSSTPTNAITFTTLP